MAIRKKIIGIHKQKKYNSETQLQTIYENNNLQNLIILRTKKYKKLKNTIYWLVFMLFAYYFFNY